MSRDPSCAPRRDRYEWTCPRCGTAHDNWDYGCIQCTRADNRREKYRRIAIARLENLSPAERRARLAGSPRQQGGEREGHQDDKGAERKSDAVSHVI